MYSKTLLLLLLLVLPAFGDRVQTTAAAASLVVATGPARLIHVIGYNAKTASQFIQVHNAASLPSEGAVPVYVFAVDASSNFSFVIPASSPEGEPFVTGIVICNSSTYATKTIGSADCWIVAKTK